MIYVERILFQFPAGALADVAKPLTHLSGGLVQGLGFDIGPAAEGLSTITATGDGIVGVAIGHDDLGAPALETFEFDRNLI